MYNEVMKKVLRGIWDEFIYGGHWPAFSSTIIAYSVYRILDLKISFSFYGCFYLLPYSIYALDRYVDDKEKKKWRLILIVLAICIMFIFSLLKTNIIFFLVINFLAAAGICYNIKFKQVTKKIAGFKNYFVALLFPSSVLMVPIFFRYSITMEVFLLYLFFTFRLFINTSFGDIKDVSQDEKEGLRTFPIIIGKNNFINLLMIINCLTVIPILIGFFAKILPFYALFYFILPFYAHLYLVEAKKDSDLKKLADYGADGEPVLWLVIGVMRGFL